MYSYTKDVYKIPFEVALDRAGFGLYSYLVCALTGLVILSFTCIVYGTMILVPTSACELETTSAQQGLLASAPLVGTIAGGVLGGYLGDTRGRRNTLLMTLFLGAVTNALISISVNWIMMIVMQFIASFLVSGNFSLALTLLSESVPMTKRNLLMLLVSSIFVLAQGLMSVVAIPIIPLSFSYYLPSLGIYWNSWRTLVVIYSLPGLISMCWLSLMKESPKFVFLKGSEQEAIEILKFIHGMNNKKGQKYEVYGLQKEKSLITDRSKRGQILPLFKRPFLKYTVILIVLNLLQVVGPFIVWLPTIANQFIIMFRTGEAMDLTLCGVIALDLDAISHADVTTPCGLNETALLIVLSVGVGQSLVNTIISVIVNKTGRRIIVIAITAVCGLCGILVNLVPHAIISVVLFGVFLLGILVIGLYAAIVVALFPTHLRALAVAVTATGSQLGSVVLIQILNWMLTSNCEIAFYLFSGLFASSAVVASFLPDDRLFARRPSPRKDIETTKF
ncbi:probable metabolite transport protein CsbC [Achroia grisella]|uniref:probable metabolite transport protein CsbC n=1 Tax=Achroia grisella TaxID=688607 RepID=UPI0027D22A2C|nr:probable metabolite transport protein CsbC [Achroia grisella]